MNPPPRVHLFGGTTDTVGHIKTFASWRAFREYLVNAGPFKSKVDCPMFSGGIFDGPIKGRIPTEFTLVVGEHDACEVGVDEAVSRLEKAGIAAFIHTSASHTPESPRWRVVAPLQRPCSTEDYLGHLNLLNGALGRCLATESGDLGRRWYYGQVESAVDYDYAVTKEGALIDEMAATDHGVKSIPVKPPKKVAGAPANTEPRTDHDISRAISALQTIPNGGRQRLPYEQWVTFAMALHEGTGGDQRGLETLIEWTADGQDEKTAAIWHGFTIRDGGITRATLIKAARDAGWQDPGEAPDVFGLEVLADDVDVEAETRRLLTAYGRGEQTDDDVRAFAALPGEAQERIFAALDLAFSAEEVAATRAAIERAKAKGQVVVPAALTHNSRGKIEATYTNVYEACARPEVIRLTLGYDEFLDETVISVDEGANWVAMTDADYVQIQKRLEGVGFSRVAKEVLRDVVGAVACRARRFDTAKLWLDRLQWDGAPRVERFMSTYLGAEDTPYTRAVARYQWTAMAGRVLDPGCQADMVPVWVGSQGAKKSSVARALVPDARFFKELSFGERDADLSRKMRGLLIGELGELRGLATRELEAVKAWITQRDEHWTPKFKEFGTTFARRCVFIGTTNQQQFLADETGERRWLPVRVGECDPVGVARDREQLWADAREMYLSGGIAWEEAERLAKAEHDRYKVHDSWADAIHRWLDEVDQRDLPGEGGPSATGEGKRRDRAFTTGEVMAGALRIEAAHQRTADQMRVAKVLRAAGFECDKHQSRADGDRVRYWRATR